MHHCACRRGARTRLLFEWKESGNLFLDILYFHRFQTEAELICGVLNHTGGTVLAVSPERPNDLTSLVSPDVILVDRWSVPAWKTLEHEAPCCRLLADLCPPVLDSDSSPRGHFDGRIFVDLSMPPWELLRRVMDAVERCTGDRGAVRPFGRPDAPPPERIIRGNPVNERILTLIAFGMSDKEISSSLCVSSQTIRNRISRMLHDGAFNNRTALAVHFLQNARTEVLGREGNPTPSFPADRNGLGWPTST